MTFIRIVKSRSILLFEHCSFVLKNGTHFSDLALERFARAPRRSVEDR